ncbi:MAG: hypothetical protein Q9186_003816 [Xanthomendoza sp. 1 TL-2023]
MYTNLIHNLSLFLLITTTLSLSLSLSLPATPAINNNNNNINQTPPLDSPIPNFTLVPLPPSSSAQIPAPNCLRPAPQKPTVGLLASTISRTLGRSPASARFGREYFSIGPESAPNLAHLDTRITVRQYHSRDWDDREGRRSGIREGSMKNGEVVYAATLVANMYAREEARTEGAWRMCYLKEETGGRSGEVEMCTGVLMVQRDLWLRKVGGPVAES